MTLEERKLNVILGMIKETPQQERNLLSMAIKDVIVAEEKTIDIMETNLKALEERRNKLFSQNEGSC